MSERPRILCVVNSLEGGGAERVFVQVAGALMRSAWRPSVHIALLDAAERRYAAPPGAPLAQLDARGGLAAGARQLLATARAVRPDLLLSFLTRANCASILVGAALGVPAVVSERIDTRRHFGPGAGLQHRMVRLLYPRARRVLAVSRGVGDALCGRYGVSRARLVVIPNPVDAQALRAAAAAEPACALPPRFLAAIGRLVPAKNFPMLLHAFARSDAFPHLVVMGEGPERPRLEGLAAALGLARRVRFLGFVGNPHAILARAAGYAASSNVEGFPNALVEAMALGVPVLATDCPSGPAEILERPAQAPAGLLQLPAGLLAPVGDEPAFTQGLHRLARPAIAAALARGGAARIAAYSPERVFAAYEQALWEALPPHRRPADRPAALGAPACVSA